MLPKIARVPPKVGRVAHTWWRALVEASVAPARVLLLLLLLMSPIL
jgi:hypothetical protein